MPKIGFSLQSENQFWINTTPGVFAPDGYVKLAAGITSFDPQWNEEIDQTQYLDGDGYGSSDVTGAQLVIAFEGHRKYGDAAQDFVAGLQSVVGEGRKTEFKWIDADGDQYTGKITVANIVASSGAANEKSAFSFEAHYNGKPVFTPSSNDTTAPTVTTVPVDAATAVAVSANVVWTFNEAIQDGSVSDSNFFLMKASDGTLVPATLSINGAKTIVTLDPVSNLTAATPYIAIATTNVKDLAGNRLAVNNVVNFTTA